MQTFQLHSKTQPTFHITNKTNQYTHQHTTTYSPSQRVRISCPRSRRRTSGRRQTAPPSASHSRPRDARTRPDCTAVAVCAGEQVGHGSCHLNDRENSNLIDIFQLKLAEENTKNRHQDITILLRLLFKSQSYSVTT